MRELSSYSTTTTMASHLIDFFSSFMFFTTYRKRKWRPVAPEEKIENALIDNGSVSRASVKAVRLSRRHLN